MASKKIVDSINGILPQTQCQNCGYPDCYTYADAISKSKAKINRCAPGGKEVIRDLAELMNTSIIPLDKDITATDLESTALIDEQFCIGCALCIDARPIDSIIGSAKKTHSILNSLCSGCGLCLPPCPTSCIEIVPLDNTLTRNKPSSLQLIELDQVSRSDLWKNRYKSKQSRLAKQNLEMSKKTPQSNQNSSNINKIKRISAAMDIARKKLMESYPN